jgi:L-asparaginase/Glu-tRNA(Gln) amidotransferase subunit D
VHGTDTLPHTASAVAYALGEGLSFPVVFVGSQTAPHVIHGDARINLMRACTLATRNDIPEVVAVINDQIHRAVRVEKRDDFRFDGMHSPTFEPLGLIADRIEIKESLVRKLPKIPEITLRNEFSHNVFKIGLYPGLDPDFLKPILNDSNLEGVIIETLGIGNIPVEGKWSLIPFIEKATSLNIPVLLVSQFPIQPEMTAKYQPASAPLAAGAIGAANMAPPAAVTKFMWVLPQIRRRIDAGSVRIDDKRAEVARWMNLDFVGEVGLRPANKG